MAEDPEEVAEAEARDQLPRGSAAVPRFHVLLTTFELASKVRLARHLLWLGRHCATASTMLVITHQHQHQPEHRTLTAYRHLFAVRRIRGSCADSPGRRRSLTRATA